MMVVYRNMFVALNSFSFLPYCKA